MLDDDPASADLRADWHGAAGEVNMEGPHHVNAFGRLEKAELISYPRVEVH